MLTRLVAELPRRTADLLIASTNEDWLAPTARDRNFLRESRREAVDADASPEPVTALAKFDTLISDGACATRSKIWLIELGSLDRPAKLLISDAVDDSRPRDTACPGSPRRPAISLMLLESSRLKSDENTDADIFHPVTFSVRRCRKSHGAIFRNAAGC